MAVLMLKCPAPSNIAHCIKEADIYVPARTFISAARSVGLTKSADDLARFRRDLKKMKANPCMACKNSEGQDLLRIPRIVSSIRTRLVYEEGQVAGLAAENSGGFIYADKDTHRFIRFSPRNDFLFRLLQIAQGFGARSRVIHPDDIVKKVDVPDESAPGAVETITRLEAVKRAIEAELNRIVEALEAK